MVMLLFSTIISKDLYHLLLPHNYAAHHTITSSGEHELYDSGTSGSECFICHFEFSTSDCETIAYPFQSLGIIGLYDAIPYNAPSLKVYTHDISLRGPPAVC